MCPDILLFYIAGPYRAATQWLQEQNIRRAENVAYEIWQCDHFAICPHTNSRFSHDAVPDKNWIAGTLEIMRRCDAVIVLPGWETSEGTCGEIAEAERLGMPLVYLSAYYDPSGYDSVDYAELIDAAVAAKRESAA